MNRNSQYRRKGFTLLEVVLSLTVFLVIAAPIVGLIAMTVESGQIGARAIDAEELARRLSNEIGATGSAPLGWDLASNPQTLYASRDLTQVGFPDTVNAADRYFQASVLDPVGADYSHTSQDHSRRLILLEIRWPAYENGAPTVVQSKLDQIIVPLVIHKQ